MSSPNAVDRYIGLRIRLRRIALGLTPDAFAAALNIGVAQVRAYEDGTTRVSVARMQAIAEVLEVPVCYFFEEGVDVTG